MDEESEDTIACWKRREEEVIEHLHAMRLAHQALQVAHPMHLESSANEKSEPEGGEIDIEPPQRRSPSPEKRHADWPLERSRTKRPRKEPVMHASDSSEESDDKADEDYNSKNRSQRSFGRPDTDLWLTQALNITKQGYNLRSIVVKLEQAVPAFLSWACTVETKINAVKEVIKTAFGVEGDLHKFLGKLQVPEPDMKYDAVLTRLRRLRVLYESPNPPPAKRWRAALREPGLNEAALKDRHIDLLCQARVMGDRDLFDELLAIAKVLGDTSKDPQWRRAMERIETMPMPTQQKPGKIVIKGITFHTPTKVATALSQLRKTTGVIDLTGREEEEKPKPKPIVIIDLVVSEEEMDIVQGEEVYDAEVLA